MYDDFWDEFEAQCAATGLISKVPECIKTLLTKCGYNSTWSFKSVTEEKLSEAEHFIESQYRKHADEFEEYKDIKPFKFLPGHKALIFGIKSEIDDFQENKRPKKNTKSKFILDERDIQTSLLHQMSAFTKGLDLQADWSKSIKDSSFTKTENALFGTCTVLCPICTSVFIIRYDKHWKNSNICKHVRKHVRTNGIGEKTTDDLDKNSNETNTNEPNTNAANSKNNPFIIYEDVIVVHEDSMHSED